MDEQKYSEWSLGVHRRLSTKRIPISGSIEVTQRCNNQCLHCYNNLSVGDQIARRAELSSDEHCRILNQIADAGCLWLLFTGGGIFVRKDFLDIYTYARQKGFLITLFTNGTLITPDIADQLAQLPPFSIEITIYGHTKLTYESVTKISGSFKRCIQGINLLVERKLPLKLKTMAISADKHEIQNLKQFVEEDLGLEFKFDAMINPRLDCSQSPLEVRLTPAEVVELDLKYLDIHTHILWADRIQSRDLLINISQEEIFRNARPINAENSAVLCLDSPDQFLYLSLHALKHNLERLIWLVDIKSLIAKWELSDWKALMNRAEELGLEATLIYTLYILRNIFQLELPSEMSFYLDCGKLNLFERRILDRRINGYPIPSWGQLILIPAGKSLRTKISIVKETLFPRPIVLRQVFPDSPNLSARQLYRKRILQILGSLRT